MRIGDVVRHRVDGTLGTVEYSTFGLSIHFWDEGRLAKTLGDMFENINKYWEVIDLPDGYEVHEYGGVVHVGEK